MLDLWPEDPAKVLLVDAPLGTYLLERIGRWQILWRVADGELPDGAFEPADDWFLLAA